MNSHSALMPFRTQELTSKADEEQAATILGTCVEDFLEAETLEQQRSVMFRLIELRDSCPSHMEQRIKDVLYSMRRRVRAVG